MTMTAGDESPIDPQEAFAELGKFVLGDQPLETILDRVVHLARGMFLTPVEASITLVSGAKTTTAAFTGRVALDLDERQYADGRGPCLDAAASGQRVFIKDMNDEPRWPQFGKSAVARGVRSSLSIPLPIQRQVTGALNFYGTGPDAFDEEMIDLAETFAGHAAVAVANAHLYESTAALARQMQEAMANRAVIEQAKGIMMRDRGCDADEAFNVLVSLSQESHMKLREVAQRLVDEVQKG
jgi:GAF domain-containing protein